MKKDDFQRTVTGRFQAVPLATRKLWRGVDALTWWFTEAGRSPSLRWDRCRGDHWQVVHGMIRDHYGPDAKW